MARRVNGNGMTAWTLDFPLAGGFPWFGNPSWRQKPSSKGDVEAEAHATVRSGFGCLRTKHLKKALSHLRHLWTGGPCPCRPDGEIVDGHPIYEALKELGHDEIEVVVVQNLQPDRTAGPWELFLNRLSLDSKWDSGQLKGAFGELLEIGFDLSLSGFDQVEIDVALSIDDPASGTVEQVTLSA